MMKTTFCSLLAVALAASAVCALARPPQNPPRVVAATMSDDEKALRLVSDTFVQAFGKGDANAIGSLFTTGAEALDPEGESIRGREVIEDHYRTRFSETPGDKIEATITAMNMLAPGVASMEGRSKLIPADGELPSTSRFSTVFAKVDGKWLIASVRELEDNALTPHDRLKELEWMIGDWVQESGESVVLNSYAWSDDTNFIIRTYDIRVEGKPDLKGTQRIGWDPLTEQFKSWVFDSRGGHSEAIWIRKGAEWIVKTKGVRPDGLVSTATQVLTRVNKDRVKWKSIDRTLGDSVAEDIDEVVMVRKPPEPK